MSILAQYSLQQVSKDLCISKETLRYYDKIGLISPVRGENRYRTYTQDDVYNLMYVRVMKYAGFSLSEIKRVLHNKNDATRIRENTCNSLALLSDKRTETLRKISSLKSIVKLLDMSIHAVEGKNCVSEIDELVNNIHRSIQIGGGLDV